MEKNESQSDIQAQVYEIGYLLVPTLAEEQLPAEVENIKKILDKQGVAHISEDSPKLRPLAYTMVKALNAERKKFDKAYFGWVKFEADPAAIPTIKADLDKDLSILRSILIKTVKESTLMGQRMAFKPVPEGEKAKTEAPVMSEAEIDKTIDNLVV